MPMTELPDIYFIRHGQTDWNRDGRYQGQKDIPLNQTGQGQADANGALLRDLLDRDGRAPGDFGWIASPLCRTRETMDRVRAAFEPPLPDVNFDDRLIEISFGRFEGLLASQMKGDGPAGMQAMGHREESFWHYRPEDGESYDDVSARVFPLIKGLAGPSVIVAHGGVARVFRRLIENMPKEDAVNWGIPQDVILYFSGGRMTMIPAGNADLD